MPKTDEEIDAIAKRAEAAETAAKAAHQRAEAAEARAAKLEQDNPGMVTRLVSKQLEGHKPTTPPAPEVKKTDTDRIAALEAERDAMKSEKELAQIENQIRAVVGKVEWCDPNEAVHELMGKVKRADDGSLYVPGKQKIAGKDFDAQLSLEDGMKDLATRKPHWVKVKVQGGSGAGGSNGGEVPETMTYAELMKPQNAAKLTEYMTKYPDKWQKIQDEGLDGLRAKKK